MRAFLAVCLALLGGCDDSLHGTIRPEPEAVAAGSEQSAAAPARAPAAVAPAETAQPPWGVRFVRQCSMWSGQQLLATAHRVLTCANAVYDLDGALVDARDLGWPVAATEDHFLFRPEGTEEELAARGEGPVPESMVVVRDEDLVRVGLSPEPPEAELRSVDGASVLAERDGNLLVSTDAQTELWPGGRRADAERVYDAPAWKGVLAGDRIVLRVQDDVIWLERGAVSQTTVEPPPAPAGHETLTAATETGRDGPAPVFRSREGDTYPRSLASLVSFQGRRGMAVVSRIDPVELSRFAHDDAEWARVAAARYVDRGQHRWARYWRGEDGKRRLRGHTYIGGCERLDIFIFLREDEHGLELWQVLGNDVPLLRALEPIPAGARSVTEATEDRYGGDPSIGRVR